MLLRAQGVVTCANVLLEVLLSAPAGAIATAAATATANERCAVQTPTAHAVAAFGALPECA